MKLKQSTIEKLKSITDHTKIGMLRTNNGKEGHAFPMTTKEVDEEGALWFFSSTETQHFRDLKIDDHAELTYCNESMSEYLHITGQIHLIRDKKRIEELWSPLMETWYDGKEDPTIVLYQFHADEAYTWENPEGKVVAFFKMLRSAITGDHEDIGQKEELTT